MERDNLGDVGGSDTKENCFFSWLILWCACFRNL